mgnify:CR=1 FL=1
MEEKDVDYINGSNRTFMELKYNKINILIITNNMF